MVIAAGGLGHAGMPPMGTRRGPHRLPPGLRQGGFDSCGGVSRVSSRPVAAAAPSDRGPFGHAGDSTLESASAASNDGSGILLAGSLAS